MDKAQNAAIGKRLRLFRESLKLPRARFAREIGFGAERLASYESGRAPLPYAVFTAIAEKFPINPIWLACGGDQPTNWEDTIIFPSAESLKTRGNARFIDVFNGPVAKAMQQNNMPSIREITLRQVNAARYSRWIQTLFRDVPFKLVDRLNEELEDVFISLVTRFPSDDEIKNFQTQLAYKNIGTSRTAERVSELLASLTLSDLTHLPTSHKKDAVNHWHRLKAQIQKATEIPGGRSILAKFLGVDLTQISRWLSKTGPEPGADYALKMLQWVQEREER